MKNMKKKYLLILIFLIHIVIIACSNGEATALNKTNSTTSLSANLVTTISYNTTSNTSAPAKDNPFKDITIVLDPGHSDIANLQEEPLSPDSLEMKIKDGGGAIGVVTKTRESDINLKVALLLEKLLKDKGFNVILTKRHPSENPGNIDRAEIGNNKNANLVLRIHCDSFDDENCYGASMLVPKAINYNTEKIYDNSLRYGRIILDNLCEHVSIYNRGIIFSDQMTGFNWSIVPVVLVEMGFLSNPKEDVLLSSEEYQKKLADGLSLGIQKCFK